MAENIIKKCEVDGLPILMSSRAVTEKCKQ